MVLVPGDEEELGPLLAVLGAAAASAPPLAALSAAFDGAWGPLVASVVAVLGGLGCCWGRTASFTLPLWDDGELLLLVFP